jgi:hypothetical protein
MRGKVITRTPFERQATVLSLSEQEYYQSKSRARDEPVGEQVEFTPVASEPARDESSNHLTSPVNDGLPLLRSKLCGAMVA